MRVNEENLLDLRAQNAWADSHLAENYRHPRDFDVPEKLGAGSLRYNNPLKGFLTAHGTYDLQDELEIEFSQEGDHHESCALEIGIMLSGKVGISTASHRDSLVPVAAGRVGIWCDTAGGHPHKAVHSSNQPIEYLVVRVAEEIVADLLDLDTHGLHKVLFETAPGALPFRRILHDANTDILVAARQYVSAPYNGRLQEMYREGKLLEILALAIDGVDIHDEAVKPLHRITKADVDRLLQARAHLLDRIDDAPSLLELAHFVGINEQKLKTGFKQLFGVTVFDYLRKHRLDVARRHLQEGDKSVSEVALSVGYSHFGHFAASFRRRFGVSPSEIKSTRGKLVLQPMPRKCHG